jgi:hypothetical protein
MKITEDGAKAFAVLLATAAVAYVIYKADQSLLSFTDWLKAKIQGMSDAAAQATQSVRDGAAAVGSAAAAPAVAVVNQQAAELRPYMETATSINADPGATTADNVAASIYVGMGAGG